MPIYPRQRPPTYAFKGHIGFLKEAGKDAGVKAVQRAMRIRELADLSKSIGQATNAAPGAVDGILDDARARRDALGLAYRAARAMVAEAEAALLGTSEASSPTMPPDLGPEFRSINPQLLASAAGPPIMRNPHDGETPPAKRQGKG